jgi:hypothetical protein
VLILSGFLGGRYVRDLPLSLHASLVFEQTYGGVEGDSASLAELVALLSALGEVPVRQSIAITGSVDQRGDVQPVGGVNEKVEGFFDACALHDLTGQQGVVIPAVNGRDLMLRRAGRGGRPVPRVAGLNGRRGAGGAHRGAGRAARPVGGVVARIGERRGGSAAVGARGDHAGLRPRRPRPLTARGPSRLLWSAEARAPTPAGHCMPIPA